MARKRFAVAVIVVMTLAMSSWAADPAEPDWAGTWQTGPPMTADMGRFDGAFDPTTGLVYFLGGRLEDGTTDGSIFSFNPATGLYADTGVDMPVPISNYTVNVLTDATGTGFYTFCGRDNAGTQNFVTQVYYPATNTVTTVAADPYPGDATHTCSGGLSVVFSNKAYVAGGFDGTNMNGWTHVFDPMAAAGSRWTRLTGADLANPRAYIMGAVVDGMIYAIGGATYPGTLTEVATVERLDPAAGTPSWNDGVVADLPEVCSDSRAWGFDAGSPYRDPADNTSLASTIISGCGVWTTVNERVYSYSVASNAWTPFPSFNITRRDIAAELVTTAGSPALWVWGGYDGSGVNAMTNTSEHYDLLRAGSWENGPVMAAGMSRFDGGWWPPTGLVYFLGGRLTDNSTDGSILSFNPSTGVYLDTGVDMPIPISNYTANALTDATGTGFYTFCGRTNAGTQNFVTQVYYPATGTTAQLPAADNYPGDATHTCSGSLSVVYNNKAYLAGGFDGTNMNPWTYVFDPMAASGSRWTRLTGADFVAPRAYIMGAVVDGLIYAIGGATFDGANLVNVATVERLDPAAGTPSWNDAAVADLPEVCSSSRAFGFNAASPYLDPVDGSPMASKIVSGCGVWATPNASVYRYTVATNSWAAFPALNVARRDIAAAMLPITGEPALWVWGGYDVGGGNSMTNTSEYYRLIVPVPVELVSFTVD